MTEIMLRLKTFLPLPPKAMTNIANSPWTPEKVGSLAYLWGLGVSASKIAAKLGDGITRNAVLGKAHRMYLSQRKSPIKSLGTEKVSLPSLCKNPACKKELFGRKNKNYCDPICASAYLKGLRELEKSFNPSKDEPIIPYVSMPHAKGWFEESTPCSCAGCKFLAPPGSLVCYGDLHA